MRKIKKQIVVHAFTPIAKPLNTTIQKNSAMLLLGELPYVNGEKTFSTKFYYIKGIRGMLRHACMALTRDCGIEVCHSSAKETFKDGAQLIPSGFHALGTCDPPCILRKIFGTFGEKSSVDVLADPIASIKHKEYTTEVPVQKVHIASENRIALTYDGVAIQDFRESYFSGYFSFFIDVTKLTNAEIKFLMEALLYVESLGSGRTSGYGRIKIFDCDLQKIETTRDIEEDSKGNYKIIEETTAKPISLSNIEDWRDSLNLSEKNEEKVTA